jgi:hypothetical protein
MSRVYKSGVKLYLLSSPKLTLEFIIVRNMGDLALEDLRWLCCSGLMQSTVYMLDARFLPLDLLIGLGFEVSIWDFLAK